MAEIEQGRLVDGFSTLTEGVNEGVRPSLLAGAEPFSANRAARLINATVRGGFATCRPPWLKFPLYFQDADDMAWFQEHNVQGRERYVTPYGSVIIVSIGGRIYRIDPAVTNAPNVLDLTIPGDPNPSVRRHAWMTQAEQYLIIQDGQSLPLIYDGSLLRRSRVGPPNYEVPVGTAMAYGLGRLVVVLATRRAYAVGDIVNGGTEVVQFTEDNYLAEGGTINVPIPGDITAVKVLAQLDRSVGQGDLMVFTRSGAASARIGEQRETWKNIQFQHVALLGAGATSQNSVTLVNGDLFMRSADGIRSLAMSQRLFESSWSNTPLSREVTRTLSFDTGHLLEYAESVLFDNRLLMLCNQAPLPDGCAHRGIVALDFDLISSMKEKLPPAYDGLWIGLNLYSILAGDFSGTDRCFGFHRNASGFNELWELKTTGYLDNNVNRIPWIIEGPALLKMGSTPQSLKRLTAGDVSLEELQGNVDVAMQFRPDQAPCWVTWKTLRFCAKTEDCSGCPLPYQPQYRAKRRFGEPPDVCQGGDNKPARLGFQFQPRLTITGKAVLHALRLACTEMSENLVGCDDE